MSRTRPKMPTRARSDQRVPRSDDPGHDVIFYINQYFDANGYSKSRVSEVKLFEKRSGFYVLFIFDLDQTKCLEFWCFHRVPKWFLKRERREGSTRGTEISYRSRGMSYPDCLFFSSMTKTTKDGLIPTGTSSYEPMCGLFDVDFDFLMTCFPRVRIMRLAFSPHAKYTETDKMRFKNASLYRDVVGVSCCLFPAHLKTVLTGLKVLAVEMEGDPNKIPDSVETLIVHGHKMPDNPYPEDKKYTILYTWEVKSDANRLFSEAANRVVKRHPLTLMDICADQIVYCAVDTAALPTFVRERIENSKHFHPLGFYGEMGELHWSFW